ncbi:hypothetical protein K503DRAFT_857681 [Rhizopogon vinicolor AM-OR11-026]|uniref:Uncharacterized protein n=1 Tax=Rhizopogon vinicolor AM-OR11-026 TaxID=1314800 RepID=A0A1B7MWF5_9AGAM|nr:hypothetical protein K503DRAFT_857681 [Rhizopogon vinicolor AM-OR11-026]
MRWAHAALVSQPSIRAAMTCQHGVYSNQGGLLQPCTRMQFSTMNCIFIHTTIIDSSRWFSSQDPNSHFHGRLLKVWFEFRLQLHSQLRICPLTPTPTGIAILSFFNLHILIHNLCHGLLKFEWSLHEGRSYRPS